jgi:uncharacterized protein (TIGR00645 family)
MKQTLQKILFAHKWMLYPFYLGLVIALGCYFINYTQELWFYVINFAHRDLSDGMMKLLELVDIVMVANLIKMVITGSYQVFVDRVKENTERVSSGILKVKMGTSLIGITSIHLLEVFIKPPPTDRELFIKVGVHIVFLLSAAILALINLWDAKSEYFDTKCTQIESNIEKDH